MLKFSDDFIAKLKSQNAPVYNWFVEHGVDLKNIGKYTSSLAMAIAFATTRPAMPAQAGEVTTTEQAATPIISVAELKGKTDLERANLVWARYGTLIRNAAEEYDLDPNLIFATIMIESGGNTYAVRQEPRIRDASYGLGQLLYGTARGIGYRGKPEGLFDPAVNIDLIARYHKRNYDHYKDLNPQELTVAYNTGSPYKKAYPGHLNKFNKWYNSLANLEVDLS